MSAEENTNNLSTQYPPRNRRQEDPRMDKVLDKLGEITNTLDRQNVALFARDAHNEFQTPGVMTIMQKFDRHLDVLCNLAKWAKRMISIVFWFGTGIAGLVAAAKAAGWL